MLRDEVAKYTELTGEDGAYVPIIKLEAYLDGYKKGLEVSQKFEPCENAVDRDTILQEMEKRHKEGDAITLGYIKNLPPVSPKREPGHWIYSKVVNTGEIVWSECSKCGEGERGCAKHRKFCSYCGAEMIGDTNELKGQN